jgi:sodium-dependent dicarboxylate transporter 2/3/5
MINSLKKMALPLLGPFLFLIVLNLDLGLNDTQATYLAIFIFVVYNWLIAWLPLFVTGFLGVGLSVLLGVENSVVALSSFANPIIFLFLAGFLFAKAMNETGLDKRISLMILGQNFIAKSFDRLLFCLLGLTAFFSMWVSNTATTAMMLPIMLGTAKSLNIKDTKTLGYMLLGLAYASSVGGLGTPVGSPPNIVAIGMLAELANIHVSFFQWTLYGTPLAFIFLLIIFFYIRSKIPFENKHIDASFLRDEASRLPPVSSGEKWLMVLFVLLLGCWFLPGLLSGLWGSDYPFLKVLDARMEAGAVGMVLASLLFIFPFGAKSKLLQAQDIRDIDWPSLLLFGSGLALGKILFSVGLAQIAGTMIVENIAGSSVLVLFLVLTFFTIFFTELASNTATANIIIPIVIAAASLFNLNPVLLAMAVALSCSLAFMLPVATPPNAIVYGSGKVDIKVMMKFGFILNIVFGFIIALLFYAASSMGFIG